MRRVNLSLFLNVLWLFGGYGERWVGSVRPKLQLRPTSFYQMRRKRKITKLKKSSLFSYPGKVLFGEINHTFRQLKTEADDLKDPGILFGQL